MELPFKLAASYILCKTSLVFKCYFYLLQLKVYNWDSLIPACETVTEDFVIKSGSSGQVYQEAVSGLLKRCNNSSRLNAVLIYYLLHEGEIYGTKNWHFFGSPKEAEGLQKSNITVRRTY